MNNALHSLVVGLGKTGLSIARHLHAAGKPFAVADTRADPPGLAQLRALAPHAAVATGALEPALLAGVDEVIVSPGLATDGPLFAAARARGIKESAGGRDAGRGHDLAGALEQRGVEETCAHHGGRRERAQLA